MWRKFTFEKIASWWNWQPDTVSNPNSECTLYENIWKYMKIWKQPDGVFSFFWKPTSSVRFLCTPWATWIRPQWWAQPHAAACSRCRQPGHWRTQAARSCGWCLEIFQERGKPNFIDLYWGWWLFLGNYHIFQPSFGQIWKKRWSIPWLEGWFDPWIHVDPLNPMLGR